MVVRVGGRLVSGRSWKRTALSLFIIIVFLPIAAAHAELQGAVEPTNANSFEGENFYVTVADSQRLPVITFSITTPLALPIVGYEQHLGWSPRTTRTETSYVLSWYGYTIQPGNATTFGFSVDVQGPGTYPVAIAATFLNGTTEKGQVTITVSTPSFIGLDVRTLAYFLGAVVILLPIGQSALVGFRRRSERKES